MPDILNPGRHTPVAVINLDRAETIHAGKTHSCTVLNKNVSCWGYNGDNQLGSDVEDEDGHPVLIHPTVSLANSGNAVFAAAGGSFTCVLFLDHTIECLGEGDDGHLGDGVENDHVELKLTNVNGISDALKIDAGRRHSCAILASGITRCWGNNYSGQLGGGTQENAYVPADVFGLHDAEEIAAGGYHSCALLNDGTVRCWGDNDYGQLGDGTMESSSTPVETLQF